MNLATKLEQLQKLLSAEPNDAFLNFGMAIELAKAQRFDESLAYFDRALASDPTYVAAHFHKGKTLISMGDVEGAKRELAMGIERAAACGEMHAKREMEEALAELQGAAERTRQYEPEQSPDREGGVPSEAGGPSDSRG